MSDSSVSIRDSILHSASLLNKQLTTSGTVVVVDVPMGRMDIAESGAKLIVRLPADDGSIEKNNETIKSIKNGDQVIVVGILRKEQRRTFLQAKSVAKAQHNNGVEK